MARLKLNKKEISQITTLQQRNSDIMFELGDIEATFRRLNNRKQELFSQLDTLLEDDTVLGKSLTDKYGKGYLDIQKNEYITEG
jgi:hypothetical protein